MGNVYVQGERLRLLDWGDASISHPFASLVVTFRFLDEVTRLPPADPWFGRLRDAYLEPWGRRLGGAFALAIRVGAFAHVFAWARQRDHLPKEARAESISGSRSCFSAQSPRRPNRTALKPHTRADEAGATQSASARQAGPKIEAHACQSRSAGDV